MEKSTKITIAIASVLAVGGVIYWFATKRKQVKEDGQVGLFGKKGVSFDMGYLQNGYVHIFGDDRAKSNDVIKVGTPITIKGTDFNGDYLVKKIWKDSNGNLGAFSTNPPIPNQSKTQDRTFEQKGKIIVKS